MIKYLLLCLIADGCVIVSDALTPPQPPQPGDVTHFLTTNGSDQSTYAFLDDDNDAPKQLEECDICKILLPHLVKQLPKSSESEDHFSSVIHAACKEIQVPVNNCTEFVKSFPVKVPSLERP